MKNPVGMIAALLEVAAVAVFAPNAQSADNTVAWYGTTDPGKVVWRHVKNGGKRYKYELPVRKYTRAVETDTIKMMYCPPGDGRYLEKSHNRCDGWFLVSPEQAGTWTVVAGYDDYIAVCFDGKWLVKNSSVDVARKSSWAATPGLHKFTLVFGDTGGAYGNKGKTRIPYSVSISVNGGDWLPFDDMVKAAARDKMDSVARNGSKPETSPRPSAGQEAGRTPAPAAAVKSAAAANTKPPRSDSEVELPPVRIRTIEEAGAAFKGIERKRRAKRAFPLVQPVADEGFLDNISPRGAIANVREMIRELVGPLKGEDEKLFEAKWNAVMDFPTKPIIEWLKKASPIISEMVRIKSFIDEATSDFTDLIDEANRARMFGAFEDAERLMEEAEDLGLSMQAAKKRMEELKAKLEELGEMPDPVEEKAAARKRRKEAEQTVRQFLSGKKSGDSIPADIMDMAGLYVTTPHAIVGVPGGKMHMVDVAKENPYDKNMATGPWSHDMLYIRPVAYFNEISVVCVYVCGKIMSRNTKGFDAGTFAFGRYENGALRFYFPHGSWDIDDKGKLKMSGRPLSDEAKALWQSYQMITLTLSDEGRSLDLRYHSTIWNFKAFDGSKDATQFFTRRLIRVKSPDDLEGILPRPSYMSGGVGRSWKDGESLEDRIRLIDGMRGSIGDTIEEMREAYTAKSHGVKIDDLPVAESTYRVLEKVEFVPVPPRYEEADRTTHDNRPSGRFHKDGNRNAYRDMAIKAAGKLKRDDSAWASEDWTVACEYGENRFAYRYHGSINGYVRRGRNGNDTKIGHYDDLHLNVVGKWLPPKPVDVAWSPIYIVINQMTEKIDAKYASTAIGQRRLIFEFIHYTSMDTKTLSNGVKRYDYVYNPNTQTGSNHYNARGCSESFLPGASGCIAIGEGVGKYNDPPYWVYPESKVAFCIGISGVAPGFKKAIGVNVAPDNPKRTAGGVRITYHFRFKQMDDKQARALSKELTDKYVSKAVEEWDRAAPPEGLDLTAYARFCKDAVEAADASGEVAEAEGEKKQPTKEEIAAAEEAKKERIAFHNENIKFIDGTISRLKAEAAKEKDESRRKALEWQIVCEESNKIHEQDLLRAEETGEFHASRTPFDNLCMMQTIESAMKEVNADRLMRKEQERLYAFTRPGSQFKLTPEQRQRVERLMDEVDVSDPIKAAMAYRKISDNLLKTDVNATLSRTSMLDDEILKYEDLLLRAQRVKLGCDITLALGGIAISGGVAAGELAPIMATKFNVLKYTYSIGCGYAESGPKGIVKGVITTYSDLADIVWSGVDGYYEGKKALRRGEKVNPWVEAAKAAGWSLFLNKGLPKIMEKVNWRKQITFGKVKTPAPKIDIDTPDVKAYKMEVKKAEADISAYIRAKNKINTMSEFDLASGKITDAQITKLRMNVVRTAAKINANPTAKAILKYEKGYGNIGKDFNLELGRIHSAVRGEFYKDMAAKGFKGVEIKAIRNASSGKSVGMDSDWGIDETGKITRNGKPVSVYECMAEGQKSWNAKYKAVTGQDAEHFSWENITSHAHPEAYRNMDILKLDGTDAKMRNLLNRTSLADAQQIADVTRFKADSMLQGDKFPRLVYVREAARGSAKDMGGKFLPAIESKMKPLARLERMAGKHGKALTPGQQRELNRLRAAHDYYSKVYKVFDDIGKGKIPPGEWDARIKEITGGRGISDTLGDLGDLFKSLVL